MTEGALEAIKAAQAAGGLLVAPISAWKISVAAQKRDGPGRIDLSGVPPGVWFRNAVRGAAARIVPTSARIAVEAAEVARVNGRKDPGDCFLIATARVRGGDRHSRWCNAFAGPSAS